MIQSNAIPSYILPHAEFSASVCSCFISDKIMEFASVVTDGEFNLIKEGPEFVVHISENDLLAMDEWCTRTHG